MWLEALLDTPRVRKTAALRKRLAFATVPAAWIARRGLGPRDYALAPPVVVNSLPKSGTHLLLQVARALPGSRYLGRFIAMSLSITQRERAPNVQVHKVRQVLPRETLGSHLYHSAEVAAALSSVNALHSFIYRDPLDVITSEAYYLAEMNRWHRKHKHFANLPDNQARLALALAGLDARYPEANARLLPYAGWAAAHTLAIRYEDMVGPRQSQQIERIVAAWRACGAQTANSDDLVNALIAAIDPGKLHTFRAGGSGKWRRGLSAAEADSLTERLAPSLVAFGYGA